MAIFDLFSKRQKRLRGEVPDIFTYDDLPQELRVQIIHIWRDAIGEDYRNSRWKEYTQYEMERADSSAMYHLIHESLCREYGKFSLVKYPSDSYENDIATYFLETNSSDDLLDIVEITFRVIDILLRGRPKGESKISPDDAISELNARFLEHGVGYQYESRQIIRKDSEIIHAEIVNPTLNLLHDPTYKGANEEFLKAHAHYRHGRFQECVAECNKAFESVMKTICDKRGWPYNQNDTAKKLIENCLAQGLIPNYLQNQFSSLRSLLESGIPTVRNRTSGHGKGVTTIVLPQYMASYILHLTATTIHFLVEAEKALP